MRIKATCVLRMEVGGFVDAAMHDLRLVAGSSEALNDGAGCTP